LFRPVIQYDPERAVEFKQEVLALFGIEPADQFHIGDHPGVVFPAKLLQVKDISQKATDNLPAGIVKKG
jgi:hypothetical protein